MPQPPRPRLRRSVAPAMAAWLALVLLVSPAARAAEERPSPPSATQRAQAYVASGRQLRAAQRKGYVTATLRQQAKGDPAILQGLIELAIHAEAAGLPRRDIRRLQAELMGPGQGKRFVHLARRLTVRAAQRQGLLTRRQRDALEDDGLASMAALEVNRIVAQGLLSRSDRDLARRHVLVLRGAVDLQVAARLLGLPDARAMQIANAFIRRAKPDDLPVAQRRLVIEAIGLHRSAAQSGLSAAELLRFVGDARWLGDAAGALTKETTWKRVRRAGSDAGLKHVVRVNHPSLPEQAFGDRSLEDLIDALRAAAAIRANARAASFWRDYDRALGEEITIDTFAATWRNTAREGGVPRIGQEASATAEKPAPTLASMAKAALDTRVTKAYLGTIAFIRYLAKRGAWANGAAAGSLLDPFAYDSLTTAIVGAGL